MHHISPGQWKPATEDPLSLERSGQLMCDYYYTIIMIHRPLMTTGPNHYAGLDICHNAAVSCLRVLAVMASRLVLLSPHLCYTTWACGIVLLTKMWMLKRSDPPGDVQAVQTDLRNCIGILQGVSKKYVRCLLMTTALSTLTDRTLSWLSRWTKTQRMM